MFVCKGSACLEDHKALTRLFAELEGVSRIKRVKCQKICDGPVVGTKVDGVLEWFDKIDSRKRRIALLELLRTGEMGRRLTKRRIEKRRGRRRR